MKTTNITSASVATLGVSYTIIISTILSVLMTSCSPSSKDLAIQKVKESLKDPKSFELVKYEVKDTTTLSELLNEMSINLTEQANIHLESAEEHQKWGGIFYSYENKLEEFKLAQEDLDKAKPLLDESKDLLDKADKVKGTDKDTIVTINHVVRCYANNSYGNKVMGEFLVRQTTKGEFMVSDHDNP